MAETLVERVTRRPSDVAEPVAVNLVLTDKTPLAGTNSPAALARYGPIPAAVARRLVDGAVADDRSRCTLRRLYRHPRSGAREEQDDDPIPIAAERACTTNRPTNMELHNCDR